MIFFSDDGEIQEREMHRSSGLLQFNEPEVVRITQNICAILYVN